MARFLVLFAMACTSETDDPSDTDPPVDTDDTDDTDMLPAVSWLVVAAGEHPGATGPAEGSPCDDVTAELLDDQTALDQWGVDQGIGSSLAYTVDWAEEMAVGGWTACTTTNHAVDVSEITDGGGGAMTVHFEVTDRDPSVAAVTTVWSVLSVEGRGWTTLAAITAD